MELFFFIYSLDLSHSLYKCLLFKDVEFEEGDVEELSFIIKYRRDKTGSSEHYVSGGLKSLVSK